MQPYDFPSQFTTDLPAHLAYPHLVDVCVRNGVKSETNSQARGVARGRNAAFRVPALCAACVAFASAGCMVLAVAPQRESETGITAMAPAQRE